MSQSKRLILGLLLSLCASSAFAKGSPIRSAKTLASKQKRLEKELVKRHMRILKKLRKKKHEWESYLEMRAILRLDPGHRQARKWLPAIPPMVSTAPSKDYPSARNELDLFAGKKLSEVLDRGLKGGLKGGDVESLALRILEYRPDHTTARRALGFSGDKIPGWEDARQKALRRAYAKARGRARSEAVAKSPFPKLEKSLGMKLAWRKSDHAWLASSFASQEQLGKIASAAELAHAAFHKDLLGVVGIFERADERPTTGTALKKFAAPVYLVLKDRAEHAVFLDKTVANKNLKVRGKNLAFVSTPWKAEKVIVLETRMGADRQEEWAALMMVYVCMGQRFGRRRPPYVTQGLARYYAGQVSGRAVLRIVAGGTMTDERDRMRGGSYGQLRGLARWVRDRFRTPLPASMGVNMALDAMSRREVSLASAFADYLLTKYPVGLGKFLRQADYGKSDLSGLLRDCFGRDAAALDEEFGKWFERHY